jgi:hypothetical protein
LFTCLTGIAQPRSERGEKIRAIKHEFITERIHLTQAQGDRFWPIYNRYENELRSVRKGFASKYPNQHAARDEHQSRKYIDDNIEFKEERLKLEKKYKNEFLKVISAQQLAQLYEAERDFKRMLIENLKKRRDNEGGGRRSGPPRR